MTRTGLALVLMLALSLVGSSVPETANLGPYKVSFDLGVPCIVEVEVPKESETYSGEKFTLYSASLSNGNSSALIAISDYEKEHVISDFEVENRMNELAHYLEGELSRKGASFKAFKREIDGFPGILMVADMPGLNTPYYSVYLLPSGDFCYIVSEFPFDDSNGNRTQNLLKTIHVEKV